MDRPPLNVVYLVYIRLALCTELRELFREPETAIAWRSIFVFCGYR